MLRTLLMLAVVGLAAALGGCASLTDAGHVAYTVTPVRDGTGKVISHELAIRDGKEFEGRQISFQAKGDAVGLTIMEGDSKAFKGQAIGAKALTVLPVTSLQDILK